MKTTDAIDEEVRRFMQASPAISNGQYPFPQNGQQYSFPPIPVSVPPVEIREEKWIVLYKCAPDKFNWNTVEGVILKDKETGHEVKMTIEELIIAAGLKW